MPIFMRLLLRYITFLVFRPFLIILSHKFLVELGWKLKHPETTISQLALLPPPPRIINWPKSPHHLGLKLQVIWKSHVFHSIIYYYSLWLSLWNWKSFQSPFSLSPKKIINRATKYSKIVMIRVILQNRTSVRSF